MQFEVGFTVWQQRARQLLDAANTAREVRDLSGWFFAVSMYATCHAGLVLTREPPKSLGEAASASLGYACVWLSYVLLDDRLTRGTQRLALAAAGTLLTALVLLDGFLMRFTSLPLREILPMLIASQHMLEGMREIGLTPLRLCLLLLGLLLSAAAGGLVLPLSARLLPKRARRPTGARASLALGGLLGMFALEQAYARDSQGDYLYRSLRIPMYAQLFSVTSQSEVLPLAEPVSHDTRREWLSGVGPARAKKHVLYVLLESFRADAIDEQVCPTMWHIAQEGTWYQNALAEATYTPLSWSVLLFDEPAPDNIFGRHPGRPQPLGGWLFSVMQRAGLQAHAFVSTNLTYAKTRERLLGEEAHLDLFQAAADAGDDPVEKNENDRVAIDRAIDFVHQHSWSIDAPQFLLVQLDSTHYTYPFPEEHAVFRPYSESLMLPRPIETEREALLLRNRYRNAAHYVDAQLARLIQALQERGVYDDTLIVLTADHGEGLAPGLQGHAPVADATKRVPLIVREPGQSPRRSQTLVSHRDILPTLIAKLGISVPQWSLRGRGLDAGDAMGVLTVAPTGRFGQLTTRELVVDLHLVFRPDSLTVTPAHSQWLGLEERDTHHSGAPRTADWLPALRNFLAAHPAPSPTPQALAPRR